jgi:hypothetical protein
MQFNSVFGFGILNEFTLLLNYLPAFWVQFMQKSAPAMSLNFNNNVKTTKITYNIDSLDLLLGVIGGFSGLIWSIMGCCVGGYSTHRQETE